MKMHLRADEANGHHTKFTVFMDGANCGQLTMTEYEATFFHDAMLFGRYLKPEEVVISGVWVKALPETLELDIPVS